MSNVARRGLLVLALIGALVPAEAQLVRALTDVKTSEIGAFAVSDDGSTTVAVSSADPFGTNPSRAFTLLELGAGSSIALPGRVAIDSLSITDDGVWVYFVSPDDLVGTNPDFGRELYRVQTDGSNLSQLTLTPAGDGDVLEATVAGGGSIVLLRATIDPLGSNTAHHEELFLLTVGSGTYAQITTLAGADLDGFGISDDGTRLVFSTNADLTGSNADGGFEIFTVLSSGALLFQRTAGATNQNNFTAPVISGDGQWLACQSDGIYAKAFGGGGAFPQIRSAGSEPSITDDGSLVVYVEANEIVSIPSTGGFPTVISPATTAARSSPVVSGDGGTVSFREDDFPSAVRLERVDIGGSNPATLLNATEPALFFADSEPHLTGDGESIVYRSTYDALGGGGYINNWDVFRIDAEGTGMMRLTSTAFAGKPMLSDDGSTLIFWTQGDPVGGNPCGLPQVFSADGVGAGVLQLTDTPSPACNFWTDHPALASAADLVVYQESEKLFSIPATGGTATLVVDDNDSLRMHPRVSDDGVWTVYQSATNDDGQNPGGLPQIFRARTDGTFVERLTSGPDAAYFPDLSGDGQRIVYQSWNDPLGTNADGNAEIFLYEPATGVTTQLTSTTDGDSSLARISTDGTTVWFRSTATLSDGPGGVDLYRTVLGSGVVERVSGLADPLHGEIGERALRDNLGIEVDADGDRAVFSGSVDATGENPDRNRQLFLVDLSTAPSIRVGVAAPTLVSWDVEPAPWRYDVIRGDVATLGAAGDLGPVTCIEDESLDARTAGDEDAPQPTPGQVFFYLYRGADVGGPGSYGTATGGAARLPSSGDCPS